MKLPFSALSWRYQYSIDFTLVPVSIILIEFAVFASQLASIDSHELRNLVLLRIIHTLIMLVVAQGVSQLYLLLKKTEANFQLIAFTGVSVIAIGDLIHIYLASKFGIELISFTRRIGIIVFEGLIWFPAFLFFAGNRRQILEIFREYERRLIISARTRSRGSLEFGAIRGEVEVEIREALRRRCLDIKESISRALSADMELTALNKLIGPDLLGRDLRRFSLNLDNLNTKRDSESQLMRKMQSLKIFFQQFRLLYKSAVRTYPLSASSYPLVFFALVTPLFLYFYSPRDFIDHLFPILLSVIFLGQLITRLQRISRKSAHMAPSFLILGAGYTPLIIERVGSELSNESDHQIPYLVTAFALPITYYISMELLQVLRPKVLSLLQKNELSSGTALNERVFEIVSGELSKNLSHQWAVFIHGKILTRLAAFSLKLEASAHAEDSTTFFETVDSLYRLLDSPDSEFESKLMTLEAEVQSRLEPWRGLLEIILRIDNGLNQLQTDRVRDLGEVIEELISNSMRHGSAQRIEIRISRSGSSDIEVTSIDDSSVAPTILDSKTGLGTRIFNLASDGRWSLTRVGSSTEFRLTMAI